MITAPVLKGLGRKSQPNFSHYVTKIEAQAKKWFSYKKNVYSGFCMQHPKLNGKHLLWRHFYRLPYKKLTKIRIRYSQFPWDERENERGVWRYLFPKQEGGLNNSNNLSFQFLLVENSFQCTIGLIFNLHYLTN